MAFLETSDGLSAEPEWSYCPDLDRWDIFVDFPTDLQSRLGYDAIRVYRYPEHAGPVFYPWLDGECDEYSALPIDIVKRLAAILPPVDPTDRD